MAVKVVTFVFLGNPTKLATGTAIPQNGKQVHEWLPKMGVDGIIGIFDSVAKSLGRQPSRLKVAQVSVSSDGTIEGEELEVQPQLLFFKLQSCVEEPDDVGIYFSSAQLDNNRLTVTLYYHFLDNDTAVGGTETTGAASDLVDSGGGSGVTAVGRKRRRAPPDPSASFTGEVNYHTAYLLPRCDQTGMYVFGRYHSTPNWEEHRKEAGMVLDVPWWPDAWIELLAVCGQLARDQGYTMRQTEGHIVIGVAAANLGGTLLVAS